MTGGGIASQSATDRIDLQIKFSFTVTPMPLRSNGVNSMPFGWHAWVH